MTAPRAELITDPSALADIEGPWRELAESRSNAFITPEWFHAWWRAQGARHCEPRISVARRADGTVAGIVPLVLDRSSWPRTIRFAGASISDRLHPAAAIADEAAVARATMAALDREPDRASMVLLERTDSDRDWWRQMPSAAANRCTIVEQRQTMAPYIDLSGHDWESYLASRSHNFRKQARRALRRLRRDHSMEIRTCTEETLPTDLELLFRLHDLRLREHGGSSLLPGDRRSLSLFAARALRRGWLRLRILEADGSPVAGFLGWRIGRSFASYQGGFDPAWSRQSVGFALESAMVREAIDDGAAEYDFLVGTEGWKARFTTDARRNQTAVILPARSALRLLVVAEARARELAQRLDGRQTLRPVVRTLHALIPTAQRT